VEAEGTICNKDQELLPSLNLGALDRDGISEIQCGDWMIQAEYCVCDNKTQALAASGPHQNT